MSFTLFDVLILIGITQGVVAVFLLLLNRERDSSDVFLALAILTFCLLFLKILFNYNGLSSEIGFRYLPNAFELATAPLLYFYLLSLTEKDFHWKASLLIHFIPFALAQSYAFIVYFSAFDQLTVQLQDFAAKNLHYKAIKEVEDWLIVLSILSYLFIGYWKYIAFHLQVKNNTADSAFPTLSWLRNILFLSGILLLLLIINMGLSRLTSLEQNTEVHWQLYFIYQAVMTYYIGFMAYHQKKPDLNQIYQTETITGNRKISTQKGESIIKNLNDLLKFQKIYLEPKLNINEVAKLLKINSSSLSQVINDCFNKSFRELINDYRVEDVKKKLLNADNNASVLSLALESGFNSEASFYRVFKNATGQTPKAFINENSDQA